jgi:hypothetical protein
MGGSVWSLGDWMANALGSWFMVIAVAYAKSLASANALKDGHYGMRTTS